MVGEERPGETVGIRGDQVAGEPFEEGSSILVIDEDVAALDAAGDDVLQDVGDIDAGGAWHLFTIMNCYWWKRE